MAKRFPARLHVLLAQKAPLGVVLRRGPSKSICSILWDRREDVFTTAQWLRGRIYERRSDLAPDGKHLIYFAMNGRWNSGIRGSWTAVSRAPWLKAIVLLGKGDCWHGGGLFTSNQTYWLNDGCGHRIMQDSREVCRDTAYQPQAHYGGECPGVYYVRLQRDGWQLKTQLGHRLDSCMIFEKSLPQGWILRKFAHEQVGAPPGKGCYWDEHELEHQASGTLLTCPQWEWAELDGDTVAWAEKGCLYRAHLKGSNGLVETTLLQDFNDLTFEAKSAPY